MRSSQGLRLLSLLEICLGRLSLCSGELIWGGGLLFRGGGIFFRVVRKLSYQAKIDGDHGVESWVWGPHGHKYLSHGADVLIHASFVDDIVVGCRYDFADLVSKYM